MSVMAGSSTLLPAAAEEDDAVLQQEVAGVVLPLPRVVAVALAAADRRAGWSSRTWQDSPGQAMQRCDALRGRRQLATATVRALASAFGIPRRLLVGRWRRLGGRVLHLAGDGLLLDGATAPAACLLAAAARPRTRRCPGSGRAPCARSSRRPARRACLPSPAGRGRGAATRRSGRRCARSRRRCRRR